MGQRFKTSTDTVQIATDLADKANHLVTRGADNTVAIAADAAAPLFILLDGYDGSTTPTVGTIASAGAEGTVALVKLGGTVTGGAKITANASGQGIATTTAGDFYVGVCTESGIAGDLVPVDFAINGIVPA